MLQEKLALDIGNWRKTPKPQIVEDLASASLEQRRSTLENRISFYQLFLNENGQLESPTFGVVKDHFRHETDLDILETRAFDKLTDWVDTNDNGTSIWISPPSEIYTESRFIVFEIEDSLSKKILNCRAICGNQTQKDCLFIAKQLTAFSDTELPSLETVDALRENIIPFTPKSPYTHWIDLLADTIPNPKIWEKIRNGEDKEDKIKAKKVAEVIIDKFQKDIYNARGIETILVGADIEAAAAREGYEFQESGSCGSSNTSVKNKLFGPVFESPFDTMYFKLPMEVEDKYEYHKGSCIKCHNTNTEVGPCDICKKCEKEYST